MSAVATREATSETGTAEDRQQLLKSMQRKEAWRRRIPLLPALLFTIVVTQVPFLFSLWYSLTEWKIVPPEPRRFIGLDNYVNKKGAAEYQRYDDVKKMPRGATIAKSSFTIQANGKAALGPLFIMEKMRGGFNKDTADWRYAMVMPGGKLFGLTGGKNAAGLKFCHDCHIGAEDNDMMLFLPEEVRK